MGFNFLNRCYAFQPSLFIRDVFNIEIGKLVMKFVPDAIYRED